MTYNPFKREDSGFAYASVVILILAVVGWFIPTFAITIPLIALSIYVAIGVPVTIVAIFMIGIIPGGNPLLRALSFLLVVPYWPMTVVLMWEDRRG